MGTIKTRTWTHPGTGEIREYINPADVWEAMPRTDQWGFAYKNADERRVLDAKYWLDGKGDLHIDRLVERGRIAEADVRDAITAALADTADED